MIVVMVVMMIMMVIVTMVMIVVMCRVGMFICQKKGINIQNRIQVKAADVYQLLKVGFSEINDFNRRAWVHVYDAASQGSELSIGHQIFFGNQDAIGKANLFLCLFLFVECCHAVLGVNDRHDRV